ncbi:mobilization protein [Acidocella facilis]|uniref:mobilization protein n=1 Tax=Acidocella facilis TaxID=525 RepID=UPI001F34B32B|nr:mobilization protein [Acidocella facilis]
MAKKTIAERLAQLDAQREALRARLGKEERAKDTRRKILLGALVLHRLGEDKREFDKALKEWLQRELPGFLTRDDDKVLFADLLAAPVPTSVQAVPSSSQAAPTATDGTAET